MGLTHTLESLTKLQNFECKITSSGKSWKMILVLENCGKVLSSKICTELV